MKKDEIFISIIMASYNYENYISEAIESVINQTHPYWELIIIDDGSNDNSVELIKSFCNSDERIHLYQHQNESNKGLKDTLLLGLEKASYEWVAFLESDDVFKPNYLEEKIKTINEYPEAGLIFNNVEFFGDEKLIRSFAEYRRLRDELLAKDKIKYTDFLEINFIPTFSCVMLKIGLLKECKFFSIIPQNIDWILWTQLVHKTKFAYINKKLTKWRKHPQNYINSLCIDEQNKFKKQLLKNLSCNHWNKTLIEIHTFINKRRIEKLLRPQVRAISSIIEYMLLNKKFVKLFKLFDDQIVDNTTYSIKQEVKSCQ